MTLRSLGLYIKKLQSKVGLGGYDILFAYFVVEAKSKIVSRFFDKLIIRVFRMNFFIKIDSRNLCSPYRGALHRQPKYF